MSNSESKQQQQKQEIEIPQDNQKLLELFVSMEKNENNFDQIAKVVKEISERLTGFLNVQILNDAEQRKPFLTLQKLLMSEQTVQALIRCLVLANSSVMVESFCILFRWFGMSDKLNEMLKLNVPTARELLTTPEMLEALLRSLSIVETEDALENVLRIISWLFIDNSERSAKEEYVEKVAYVIGLICSEDWEITEFYSIPFVRDFLVNLLKTSTTVASSEAVYFAITSLCEDNPEGQAMFSIPVVRDSIIANFKQHVENSADEVPSSWYSKFANAVGEISIDSAGKALFSTRATRDALLVALQKTIDQDDGIDDVLFTIKSICYENFQGQLLFSTPAVHDAIVACFDRASPNVVCQTLTNICNDNSNGLNVFCTSSVRDALIAVLNKTDDAEAIRTACNTISWLCSENDALFSTEETRDALLASFKQATTADSVSGVYCAIARFCEGNLEGGKLFSTREARDAIVGGFTYVVDSESAEGFCDAIAEICGNENELESFSTPALYDVLLKSFKYATTPGSVRNLCCAIGRVCFDNPEGQKFFSTAECRNAILGCYKFADDSWSLEQVFYVISNICKNNPEGRKIFSTPAVRVFCVNMIRRLLTFDNYKHTLIVASVIALSWVLNLDSPKTISNFSTSEFLQVVNDLRSEALHQGLDSEHVDTLTRIQIAIGKQLASKTENTKSSPAAAAAATPQKESKPNKKSETSAKSKNEATNTAKQKSSQEPSSSPPAVVSTSSSPSSQPTNPYTPFTPEEEKQYYAVLADPVATWKYFMGEDP